jgi:hypothetical protein
MISMRVLASYQDVADSCHLDQDNRRETPRCRGVGAVSSRGQQTGRRRRVMTVRVLKRPASSGGWNEASAPISFRCD